MNITAPRGPAYLDQVRTRRGQRQLPFDHSQPQSPVYTSTPSISSTLCFVVKTIVRSAFPPMSHGKWPPGRSANQTVLVGPERYGQPDCHRNMKGCKGWIIIGHCSFQPINYFDQDLVDFCDAEEAPNSPAICW